MVTKVIKRDGRKVSFSVDKITNAIFKAASAVGGSDQVMAEELAQKVCEYLEEKEYKIPTVVQIQDAVEKILIEEGHAATA
jgi:ribonucleoside-triphosphate reductase